MRSVTSNQDIQLLKTLQMSPTLYSRIISGQYAGMTDHARLMKLATYASTVTALLLIAAKLVAWFWTGSVSMMATLIDSCLDAAASVINLLAIRHAMQPPDKEHRFGHGKAEALAGLGQAAFIAGSAGFLLLGAMGRLMHPQVVQGIGVGISVMLFSTMMTFALLAVQRYVIRQTNSTAIQADALHYKSDLLLNASVIAALLLASQGWPGFDPLFAILIAVYILYSAWNIAMQSIQLLMDHELPESERHHIRELVLAQEHVRGMHDLRTRRSGTTTFIQLHLELDDNFSLIRAHTISDIVEMRIMQDYPDAEVIIHEDPASLMESQEVIK